MYRKLLTQCGITIKIFILTATKAGYAEAVKYECNIIIRFSYVASIFNRLNNSKFIDMCGFHFTYQKEVI